ncbi:adenylate cyclase, putative [Bdellovibrio bacteriovorus str. Tiberius]|uniref:Adenylate cyclase, putative n=1 Tax=Bdellovibrio bacteriovorus str. Tiberius TaxID=1069642 RepID=K7Z6E7_BDEBC|nr:adenylate cyclase, putative [Bdellovibrio bacteriovorus str. Tiberius]
MVLLIVGVFWLAYIISSSIQFYFNVRDLTEKEILRRQSQMQFVQESFTPLVITENFALLKDRLENARKIHLIDFYILQNGTEVVTWYNNFNNLEGINVDYQVFNQLLQNDLLAFRTVKLMDYRFTTGVFQDRTEIMKQNIWLMKGMILQELIIVTLMVGLVVYLFLKDIINLTQILANRDRSKLANLKSLSKEGQTLLTATQSYESTKKYLEYENRYYSDSLTPAILHEMKSGQKAPYAFQSTMIRVDLNGYTQIFLDKKDEYVTEIMNTYFIKARELIERYNGLIYQYVGDEIVFHIKEDKQNSQALALACLRSVFEAAQQIEASLPEGADHYFKVKGSFVLGKIRFVNQDSGFALSGLPLIESARLLSQVDDKASSSVTFYAEAADSVEGLCTVSDTKETLLKGFSKPSTLFRAKNFTTVTEALQKDVSLLTYFRSDEDLCAAYEFLSAEIESGKDQSFFTAFGILKTYKVRMSGDMQAEAFTSFLRTIQNANKTGKANDKVLSAAISLASNFVPSYLVKESLLEVLSSCLEHADPRVQANTIIVLGDLAEDIAFLRRFVYSKNNRVSADALLVSGKRNIDKELAEKLKEYLDSKNPLFQASGRFVVRSLGEHYKNTDPIFFETNPMLKDLLRKIS